MLKESFVRGVIGGGVTWELGGEGETEKRLSLEMTLMTWLFGLCGLRGLICTGTKPMKIPIVSRQHGMSISGYRPPQLIKVRW